MKKIKHIILALVLVAIMPFKVEAASGNISVTTNASTVVLGNTVTVTVKLSSSDPLGAWNFILDYDSTYLEMTSSPSDSNGAQIVGYSSVDKSKSYTFKFKTKKSGSTRLAINSYEVIDNNENAMQISTSSKTITIKTQAEIEAGYSKDNNLKWLGVENYEISPAFDANVLEYTVDVPEGTNEIVVNAEKSNGYASVEGAGTLAVTPGINKFDILVRAQNGSEKVYKLTVNVIDQNPINEQVNGTDYTVVKLKEQLEIPNYYTETTVKMGEFDIPAFYNENTGYTLIGLKDLEGNVHLHIYDESTQSYTLYNEIKFQGLTIMPLDLKEKLEGYEEYTESLLDTEIKVLKYNKDSKFYVLYGVNILTGEEGFYKYDSVNESLIAYDDEMVQTFNEEKQLYMYIILGFSGVIVLLLIIIIIILAKGRKKRVVKNNQSSIIEKEVVKNKKEKVKEKTTRD